MVFLHLMTAEEQQKTDSLNIYSSPLKSAGLHVVKQHTSTHYRLGLGSLATSDAYPSTVPLTAEVARDEVADESRATEYLVKSLSKVSQIKIATTKSYVRLLPAAGPSGLPYALTSFSDLSETQGVHR